MGLLEIKEYSFAYPQRQELTLEHINIDIHKGEFVLLCGPSGCGKSTLLRQLKTILRPHGAITGQIFFAGKELDALNEREQSARIGYVMQDPDAQLVTDKVWHELAFGLESLGFDTQTIRIRVAEMASYFGIQEWFHKGVDELSGGQKQILNLASIMVMHPQILILDEPTSQLDPIAANDFLETIYKINRELGTTILMTEHRMQEVFHLADKVIVMDQGKVILNDWPQVVARKLYEKKHPIFQAIPVPTQVFLEVEQEKAAPAVTSVEANAPEKVEGWIPLTIRDGRTYLEKKLESMEADVVHEDVIYGEVAGYGKHQNTLIEEIDVKEKQQVIDQIEDKEVLLDVSEVWFRYEKNAPDVVKGASLQIRKGELYCLLGGNGTGKSTLLSTLCRMRKPYRGKITLDGKNLQKYSDRELYQAYLGVVPQNPQTLFVKKSVRLELFEMIGGTKEKLSEEFQIDMEKAKVVEEIAKLVHLEHRMDSHPFDLSGGEQQRLALAKILLLRPKLLLMDEPTKGMDALLKKEFAQILITLKNHGVTIFMVSHDIEFCAEYADRCGMFFDGGIVSEGTPKQFFACNSFYTTAANRMARAFDREVILKDEVVELICSCRPNNKYKICDE